MKTTLFGRKLREARLSLNMSYDELSRLTGLSSSFIESVEHGSIQLSRDAVHLLTTALEANLIDMLSAAGFSLTNEFPRFYTSVIAREGEIQSVEYADNLRQLAEKLKCKLIDVYFGQHCSAKIFDNEGKEVYKYVSRDELKDKNLNEYYCDNCDSVFFSSTGSTLISCPNCEVQQNIELLTDHRKEEYCNSVCHECME